MNPKLTNEHLRRRAIVYIRQSSTGQVLRNQESQRRQYDLADRARELGFQNVVVIDDDLGRSGSGLVERPGFQQEIVAQCRIRSTGRAVRGLMQNRSGARRLDRMVARCDRVL